MVNVVLREKETALLLAAKQCRIDMVKFLIESGADVFAANEDKETVLHYMSSQGNAQMVELLLSKGCDPFQTTVSKVH